MRAPAIAIPDEVCEDLLYGVRQLGSSVRETLSGTDNSGTYSSSDHAWPLMASGSLFKHSSPDHVQRTRIRMMLRCSAKLIAMSLSSMLEDAGV